MGEMDIAFRFLLRNATTTILRLAFPGRKLEPLGSLDPSVDRPRQRTADSMFHVRDGLRDVVVHVEVEREWRANLPERLFEYASGAAVATRLPVSSIVILLRPGGQPPLGSSVYRIPGIKATSFEFRYDIVPLWQLDAHATREHLGLEAAPFCVAMSGATPAFAQNQAQQLRCDPAMTPVEREYMNRLLGIVSAVIFGNETARRIYTMESIVQDPNVQAFYDLKAEGHAEGLAEGRINAARALLYRVLAARSFVVTPKIRARIDGEPDVARLEGWHDAALTAAAIDDAFRDG
jgi:hypothetical protein